MKHFARDANVLKRTLVKWQLPSWWVVLCCDIYASLRTSDKHINGVAVFAGEAALSQAYGKHVGPMKTFDVLHDSSQNSLTHCGIRLLLRWLLRVVPGGLLWLGVPCSTWVILSRASTGRMSVFAYGSFACQDRFGPGSQ